MDSIKATTHRLRERLTSGNSARDFIKASAPGLPGFPAAHSEAHRRDPAKADEYMRTIKAASGRTGHDLSDALSLSPIGLTVRGVKHLASR